MNARQSIRYRPCAECPFRRGRYYLHEARVREIAGNMLSWDGGPFWCHKTVTYGDGFDDDPRVEDAQHCGGALAFAEKNEVSTQWMRIMGRLGAYDPSKLEDCEEVFDTIEQMLNPE